jgi:hypothetical protein
MGVNGWLRLGRVRKSPQVSVLRSFKNNGLSLQVRRGCPAGQCPRSRMRLWCVVRVFVRPPLLMDASRVREREAEEVFDLSERQNHRVRVSILQVLIQRPIFARHHWSFRSNMMAHRSHTQLMRQTRRVPQHSVGTKGGPTSRAIPRPLGSARLGSRKRIQLVRSTCGP